MLGYEREDVDWLLRANGFSDDVINDAREAVSARHVMDRRVALVDLLRGLGVIIHD